MAKRKTYEYIFADAFIGSFSKKLMTKKDLMRVIMCKDLDAAESILREYGYGRADELKEGDVEAFIRREQNKLFKLIYNTVPDHSELALCLYPFDYHNVKVCLKAEFLGVTPDDHRLMSTGEIDRRKLVAMIRDRNYMFMSRHMKKGIIEAEDLFSRGKDPRDIDIVLDRACYRDMLEAAEATKEDFLISMVKTKIDTINLSSFVRLRQLGKPWEFFKKIFIEGGYVAQNLYISCYEEPYEQAAEKFAPFGYDRILSEGASKLAKTGDFALFEKMRDDKLMEINKRAKFDLFGLTAIAGFWYGKELEIDNLRIILKGKLFDIPAEQIEERLREPYYV